MLGRAFVVEPAVLWSYGAHGDLAARFGRLFEIWEESFVESGMLWEAGDALGAAGLIPPDGLDGLDGLDDALVRIVNEVAGDAEKCQTFWTWMESMKPQEPMWHIEHVGVDPDHQGGGIGSALVKLGLARAEEDGIPAYLEAGNPRNVPLYERLGFEVIAEANAPEGGPHIWFMSCDARQAATGS
jgi:ribosomal protein S18 acetylase RimI-like enzyme